MVTGIGDMAEGMEARRHEGTKSLLLAYQRAALQSSARFTHNNWSRQTGKSFTFALKRIRRAIQRGRSQVFLSASEQQSRELMLKAQAHCMAMQKIAHALGETLFEDTGFRQLQITLSGGERIIGLPANPRTARGFTGDVFLDEFAMHQDDRAIWASVFPTILRGHGELDICSTPKGKSNMFYQLEKNESFEHTTLTIDDAIAQGLDVDRETLRAAMGDEELFRQEFLCEYLDEATAYLTYEMIAQCEDPQLTTTLDLDALNESTGECYAGVDIGRKRDLTVIWVLERVAGILVTRGLIELRNVPFRTQFDTLSSVLRCRCVKRACIDATGLGMQLAETAVEHFGSRAEAVTFTAAVKAQLAGDLRIKVEDKNLRVPADNAIRNDWHSVKRSVTTAGNVRFEGERTADGHADRFWAAALAVHAAGKPGGPASAMGGGRLVFGGPKAGIW